MGGALDGEPRAWDHAAQGRTDTRNGHLPKSDFARPCTRCSMNIHSCMQAGVRPSITRPGSDSHTDEDAAPSAAQDRAGGEPGGLPTPSVGYCADGHLEAWGVGALLASGHTMEQGDSHSLPASPRDPGMSGSLSSNGDNSADSQDQTTGCGRFTALPRSRFAWDPGASRTWDSVW